MSSWLGVDNPLDLEQIKFGHAWIDKYNEPKAIVSMAPGTTTAPDLKFTFASSAAAQAVADACQKAADGLRELEQQIEAAGPLPDPAELAEFRAWKQDQAPAGDEQ